MRRRSRCRSSGSVGRRIVGERVPTTVRQRHPSARGEGRGTILGPAVACRPAADPTASPERGKGDEPAGRSEVSGSSGPQREPPADDVAQLARAAADSTERVRCEPPPVTRSNSDEATRAAIGAAITSARRAKRPAASAITAVAAAPAGSVITAPTSAPKRPGAKRAPPRREHDHARSRPRAAARRRTPSAPPRPRAGACAESRLELVADPEEARRRPGSARPSTADQRPPGDESAAGAQDRYPPRARSPRGRRPSGPGRRRSQAGRARGPPAGDHDRSPACRVERRPPARGSPAARSPTPGREPRPASRRRQGDSDQPGREPEQKVHRSTAPARGPRCPPGGSQIGERGTSSPPAGRTDRAALSMSSGMSSP